MDNIYLALGSQKYGPYEFSKIIRFLEEGRINAATLCWYEGMDKWEKLEVIFPDLIKSKDPTMLYSVGPAEKQAPVKKQKPLKKQGKNKKKNGCVGCLLGCLTIIAVSVIGLGMLAGYSYLKNNVNKDDLLIKYYQKQNLVNLNTINQKKRLILKKKLNYQNRDQIQLDKSNVKINIYNPFDSGKQSIKLSEINNASVQRGMLISKPIDLQLSNEKESNFPIEIKFRKNRHLRTGQMFCKSISKNGKIDYPLCFDSGNYVTVIADHLTSFYPIAPRRKYPYSSVMTLPESLAHQTLPLSSKHAHSFTKDYVQHPNYRSVSKRMEYWSLFNEYFGISTNFTAFAENAMYMEGFSKFNSIVPEVGLSLAFVQLGVDLYQGHKKAAGANLAKNLGYYTIAKKLPTRAMNIAMVGVFVIDYSLNKFANEALSGRKEIYKKVNSKWLLTRQNKGENKRWWHEQLKEVIKKYKNKPAIVGKEIDRRIDRYVAKLWGNDTEVGVYQSEVQKAASTTLGGMNKKLRDEMRQDLKKAVIKYNMSVMKQLSQESLQEQQKYSEKVRLKAIRYLNKRHRIKILVVLKNGKNAQSAAGIEAGVVVKNHSYQKYWSKYLNKKGEANIPCTNLGYMNASYPHIAYIKMSVPGQKPMMLYKKFKLRSGDTDIKFIINNKDLSGRWRGTYQITENTYYDSMMKIAGLVFRFVGLNEREATKKLAAAKSVFQEPKGLRNARSLALGFQSLQGIEKYRVTARIVGNSGSATYTATAKAKNGQVIFQLKDRNGVFQFKGTIVSPTFMTGKFRIGSSMFPAAKGVWKVKKVR